MKILHACVVRRDHGAQQLDDAQEMGTKVTLIRTTAGAITAPSNSLLGCFRNYSLVSSERRKEKKGRFYFIHVSSFLAIEIHLGTNVALASLPWCELGVSSSCVVARVGFFYSVDATDSISKDGLKVNHQPVDIVMQIQCPSDID